MLGTAANILPSMSVAGLEIASILSASSAAISAGTNTKISTMVPTIVEMRSVESSPIRCAPLSAPAVARILVTSPASTLPTSQPAKPMRNAATMFGTISRNLVTIALTGSSSPPRSKTLRIAGTNRRITSQKSMLPTLLRMGCMPALAESFSSSPLASSTRLITARNATAASQATSMSNTPAIRRGRIRRRFA